MNWKNMGGGILRDNRCHVMLGDPALRLVYPSYEIVTDSVNGNASAAADTLRGLSKVVLSGHVSKNGNTLSAFNGILNVTVYDKKQNDTTLSNDMGSPQFIFTEQQNILFTGKATVVNGFVRCEFILPKRIHLAYGVGMISYYADNGTTDASGSYENIIIGGLDTNAASDAKGPLVNLYMNDANFVFGGVTDENPDLFCNLDG